MANYCKILLTGIVAFFLVSCEDTKNIVASSNRDIVIWSNRSKLNWSDFQKSCPYSQFSATAHTNITYMAWQKTGNDTMTIIVIAQFYKKMSCTKSDIYDKPKTYNFNLLTHEQYHFNIAELYARKFKKIIIDLKLKNTASLEFQTLYSNMISALHTYQKTYDEETNHSINKGQQVFWEQQIDKELEDLKQYSSPTVNILTK